MQSTQSKLEDLERQKRHLVQQSGVKGRHGIDGVLRTELCAVKEKLSAVSVDTPTEDVIMALQQEAALELKLARAETELYRIENEIGYLKQLEGLERQRVHWEHEAEQKETRKAQARIAEIDALLDGTKRWPSKPLVMGVSSSDIQDSMRKEREALENERKNLMALIGTNTESQEVARANG